MKMAIHQQWDYGVLYHALDPIPRHDLDFPNAKLQLALT